LRYFQVEAPPKAPSPTQTLPERGGLKEAPPFGGVGEAWGCKLATLYTLATVTTKISYCTYCFDIQVV